MFIWNYKNFVGTDPNLRKASDTGVSFAQWAGAANKGRNGPFAQNQVHFVSGPGTIVVQALQSGIVRSGGTSGIDHGKIVVSFTIKPTATTGTVIVSIDGDPRTNSTGTSDDFNSTITW